MTTHAHTIARLLEAGFKPAGSMVDDLEPSQQITLMRRRGAQAEVDHRGYVNGVTIAAFLASESPHSCVPAQAEFGGEFTL
jgi:hypothetical protein